MSGEKKYLATVRLGVETDTQDPTGRIVQTRPVPAFEPEYIEEKALGLIGEIEQVPPAFSAVRHRGKRAYEFARKGIKIDLKKRKVLVRYLEIVSVELPDVIMEAACSPGTYVRSLGADLGKLLGPGGHLTALRRLSSKPFAVKDALNLEELGSGHPHCVFEDKIIPLRDALPQMKEAQVEDRMAHRIRNGYQPEFKELVSESDLPGFYEGHVKLVKGTDLVAIMKVRPLSDTGERGLRIMKVFH
jgi:tRNA pseudouridine55 synthase